MFFCYYSKAIQCINNNQRSHTDESPIVMVGDKTKKTRYKQGHTKTQVAPHGLPSRLCISSQAREPGFGLCVSLTAGLIFRIAVFYLKCENRPPEKNNIIAGNRKCPGREHRVNTRAIWSYSFTNIYLKQMFLKY